METHSQRVATLLQAELSKNGPADCHLEELVAFVIGAKPAVLVFDWPCQPIDGLARACGELRFESMSIHASDALGFRHLMLVNVDAVERRARELPEFATAVGWQAKATTRENLANCFSSEMFIGFVLGFPERAVRDFDVRNRRLRRVTGRLPRVDAIRYLVQLAFMVAYRSRVVRIRDPDGHPVTSWVAFGKPDPEEAHIAERARLAYCHDIDP